MQCAGAASVCGLAGCRRRLAGTSAPGALCRTREGPGGASSRPLPGGLQPAGLGGGRDAVRARQSARTRAGCALAPAAHRRPPVAPRHRPPLAGGRARGRGGRRPPFPADFRQPCRRDLVGASGSSDRRGLPARGTQTTCTIGVALTGSFGVTPENATIAQKTARYVLIGALLLAGAWMLRRFIPALCWAVVLAIATASVYDRWRAKFSGRRRDVWAALTFTAIVGAVLLLPLIYGGVVAGREAISLARDIAASAGNGPPPLPSWMVQIPWLSHWVRDFWVEYPGPLGGG